ncbi:hypothetical protein FSP39_012235 [Pinctada imbricata]|uniref:Uncharacterized protein n=1 Tax=Pinctada imbricata TaxID=66713 RepID=A0AA88XYL1_PINIB|nr:hypothetical protein FSP39_012235 [Pinctada imbricata]
MPGQMGPGGPPRIMPHGGMPPHPYDYKGNSPSEKSSMRPWMSPGKPLLLMACRHHTAWIGNHHLIPGHLSIK